MSTPNNVAQTIHYAPEFKDPGASGTITVDRSPCRVGLTSSAAEARTLSRPTRTGVMLLIYMLHDGGDITLTVTGGFDENGTTTFTFSDAGQFAFFTSVYDGTNYIWRKIADYETGQLTPTEQAFLSGVTAGTAAASKAVVLDSSGNVVMPANGTIALSRTTVAAAGGNQSTAASLTSQVNVVTGANGSAGVALPAAATTIGPVYVVNDASAKLLVYPVSAGNDQINAITANGSFTMEGGTFSIFVPTSATQWYVETISAQLTPRPATRSTISGGATISAAQMAGGILYQDGSGGNVNMTTRTGTQIAADFPELRVGDSITIHTLCSNGNTSQLIGGTNVTLVGSGNATNTGGVFKLIKTGAIDFDLVRVG